MYEGTGLLAGAEKFFGGEEDRADGVVDCNRQAESSNLSLKLSDGERAIMLMRRCAVKHVSQDRRVGKGGEAIMSSVVCVSIRGYKEEQNILRLGRLVQAVQEGRVKCCDVRLQ